MTDNDNDDETNFNNDNAATLTTNKALNASTTAGSIFDNSDSVSKQTTPLSDNEIAAQQQIEQSRIKILQFLNDSVFNDLD